MRIITFGTRRSPAKTKAERREIYKAARLRRKRTLVDLCGGKCVDCGYSAHLAALDFDHVDPTDKKAGIAALLGDSSLDFSKIVEEAKKCVIRCANCHRIKTNPTATL